MEIRLFLNLSKVVKYAIKKYSTTTNIEKLVVISESNDIYTNLALEDWYYRNWDFKNKHMLLLWSNNPCVVIGKFQNPWLEANVNDLGRLVPEGVQLARRNSGGGTVYHDRGNLNLSFFTPREHYNRRHNLEVITKALLKNYNLKIDITKRDDLVIQECKVSGTAAKLARTIAYHHCTLLVNSNKNILSSSLKKPEYDIRTNATQSTKSKIMNLSDVNDQITVENLMVGIGKQYLLTTPECNKEIVALANQNTIDSSEMNDFVTKFRFHRPTEDEFAGLTEIRDTLISWDWIFGKCPKFTATKSYSYFTTTNIQLKINFAVENGRVQNADIELPRDVKSEDLGIELEEFKNRKFTQDLFDEIFNLLTEHLKKKNVRKIQ